MKLSLVVLAPTKLHGQVVPISRTPFLIGRDPACHLRPTSTLISNRHCALWLRGGKISVEDLDSTNGTLVNKRQVKGEVELLDGDYIEIGPLVFQICARAGTPVNAATPLPPTKLSEAATDDAAADLLLSMEDGKAESMPHHVWHEVPSGDTVLAPPPPRSDTPPTPRSPGDLPFGSSGVAKELLKQYRRRKGR